MQSEWYFGKKRKADQGCVKNYIDAYRSACDVMDDEMKEQKHLCI